ncbi:hypothetical protein HKD37_02G004525 [Glycine soja]
MQSYTPRALDRRLQEDWTKDAREGPRVLMSLRSTKFRALLSLSLHSSPSSSKLLSMASYGERKEKGKKRVEEISQDERKKIREEERRKIMKEMKREKHVSYSSHNSCKSLSEELRDYYEGRHRSHLRPHSHRRENERKPQEVNIKLPYFHGKDNVEANLDWEIRVEQQLKRKSTSKSYGSHSYPKKDQGQGILGVRPSKPKDDKGETIEKQPLKASMQEKTSSMKCFKWLGRGHITSQCPTKKTMIMRGQDIYSSQDEATTSPSSSESEEAKGGESSEEIYPQEEGQPLMVKEECKEVSVSSKRLAKKEKHFEIKTNIKEISLLRQPPHFLLCKKTLVSIATSLRLKFIPQVKELLDEGLVRKRLNPCALLVPKIGVEERIHEFQEPLDLRPHSHRREKERKPQETNINLPYFHGKDNVEAYLDWKIRVEQQLKRKSTSKSYGSHSYTKKDQGLGILGATPSKPKDDKGKTIEKQPPKASMQEKTSSIKCFKCLGGAHITSQCPTNKTMIMRGQDIYSSQDEHLPLVKMKKQKGKNLVKKSTPKKKDNN